MVLQLVGKLLLGGIISLSVIIGVLVAGGILGVPDAGLEGNEWGDVEEDSIEVHTTIWVDNPNPFGIGGDTDVEYDLLLEGVTLAEGEGADISISSGDNEFELTTELRQQRIPEWWSSHLNNDEVSDLTVDATVDTSVGPFSGSPSGSYDDEIETDLEDALDEGFSEFEGQYTATGTGLQAPDGTAIEPTVEIEDATTRWGEVTENETEIHLTTAIHNPNAYPIPTPAFQGDVEFNNMTMTDWDAHEVEVLEAHDDATIPAQTTEDRTFVVTMDNQDVPEWFGTHVDREEFTEMTITGQLAVSVNGEQVTIPQEGDAAQCHFDLTTAMFVEQDDGLDRDHCGVTPLSVTEDELDAVGATLDVTETDWWSEEFGAGAELTILTGDDTTSDGTNDTDSETNDADNETDESDNDDELLPGDDGLISGDDGLVSDSPSLTP